MTARDPDAIYATSPRPRRDLYAIYATCSRPARDLYATYTRLARSGHDLGAIWARSVCDLALSLGVSDCRRAAGFRRTSPRLQTVRDCCRVPSHFHRPKSPSNLIRRYALNTLEVVWSVAGPMGRDLDAIWTRSTCDLCAICKALKSQDYLKETLTNRHARSYYNMTCRDISAT